MTRALSPHFPRLALALLAASFGSLIACGGVKHATRGASNQAPRDPTFVEVRTTGFDGAHEVVSYSTWDVDLTETLPAKIPDGVMSEMRDEAARHGAEMLLLDRIDDAYRKVWLGLGAKRTAEGTSTNAVPECTQPGFAEALTDAKARGARCVKRLLYERPALSGKVEVLFEVDPNGRVLRAAATPDSSRDGQLQQCVVGAVHATAFGEPATFSCRGRVDVDSNALR